MAILDRVEQMKKQGLSEQEISTNLQEEGITPKAIIDAFNQSKIKNAVQGENTMNESQETYNPNMPPQPQAYPPQEQYTQQAYPLHYAQEQPVQQEGYYPQEGYSEGYGGAGGVGTDTIMEIAEQVFEEKTKKIKKELEDLREFSTLVGEKISNFGERIKKIEATIDALQIKILEKVSSYGQGIETIKKEMTMMQDTFTKMVPEIAKKQMSPEKTAGKKKISKK